ncbi:MAG: hypothetical protein AB1Z98_02280 [Nannocystaceae bacterium]
MSTGQPPRRGILASKPAAIVFGVGFVVALFVAAQALGPDDPRTRSCYETEREMIEAIELDPTQQKFRYLGNDFEACRDGCDDEGDVGSCWSTARIYAEGRGLFYEDGVDLAMAQEYATRACTLAGEASCPGADGYRCRGDRSACEERCRDGAGADCVTLAKGLDAIGGKDYDPARAVELHGRACRTGIEESCAKERRLLCASRPLDCTERCKAGEAALCYELGEILSRGIGEVSQNPTKGLELKRRGCELDVAVHDECRKVLNEAKIEL